MSSLQAEDGTEIKNEDLIMDHVLKFYTTPYAQRAITQEEVQEQSKALALLDWTVSDEENRKLLEIPEADEVLKANTGCQLLKLGQYITYLGCRFGLEKSEEERASDLEKKLQNKLGSYKSLETPCRAFLRGTNSESKPKTSLVSWSCINKTKRNGGLQVRPFHTVLEVLKMRYVGRLLNGEISDWATMRLENTPNWRWKSSKGSWPGWSHPVSFWHKLVEAEDLPDDLTNKWPLGVYELTWASRWQKLWSTGATTRIKLWTWKILRRAFFTGERASTMNITDSTCCRCKEDRETVPHLFFECRHSRLRWRQLREATTDAQVNFHIPQGHLQIIDEAIKHKQSGNPLIYILHNVTKAIWSYRNQSLFHNGLQMMLISLLLEQTRIEIENSFNNKSTDMRWQQGICDLDDISRLLAQIQHSTCAPPTSNVLAENTEQTNPQSTGSTHELNSNQMCSNTSIEFLTSVCSLVSSLSGRMAEVQLAGSPT
ncbi:hypothetical protein R1flu_011023 [Riccia fluitans]|uniref:Reverse transcriptase zinc-binding domain-containing protein n=1 Tax=Riccia fluitans TaxID=41844 RepID=A0ABD1Z6N1_9MARC